MDATMWRKHLAMAEEHVVTAARNLQQQRFVAAVRAHCGLPTDTALRLAETYEGLLELHIRHRDRLKLDLATVDARDLRGTIR